MSPDQTAAFQALDQAQIALKNGNTQTARQLAVQAAGLAPELEEVWLMLAALSAPRASINYLQKALQINPHSQRAQKGLAQAAESLRNDPVVAVQAEPVRKAAVLVPVTQPQAAPPQNTRNRNRIAYAALLLLLICLIGAAAIASMTNPVSALFNPPSKQVGSSVPFWAQVNVSKPSQAPSPTSAAGPSLTSAPAASLMPTASFTPTETFTPLPLPSVTPTSQFTATATETETPTTLPSETPTQGASPTPLPTDTAEPTAAPLPTQSPVQAPASNSGTGNGSGSGTAKGSASSAAGGVHWIDVDLTNQMVYAYEGDTLVNSFLVSTGAAPHLTVTGSFHIYERHVKGNMWGPGYFLPDVPYIMYFYKGYGLHGTYWHSNFGTPMSHGCVNLATPDAEWLYYWSTWGTLVKVHY